MVCGEVLCVGKAKTKLRYRFNNSIDERKAKHGAFRKKNRKILHKLFLNHYSLDGNIVVDDWDFIFFKQYETNKQWKKRKPFGNTDLKTFCLRLSCSLGLHEKGEC